MLQTGVNPTQLPPASLSARLLPASPRVLPSPFLNAHQNSSNIKPVPVRIPIVTNIPIVNTKTTLEHIVESIGDVESSEEDSIHANENDEDPESFHQHTFKIRIIPPNIAPCMLTILLYLQCLLFTTFLHSRI